MIEKYILTGGPGSGKSSIILELESRGEYVVRESAEDVKRWYRSKGILVPENHPDLQKDILRFQVQREKRIPLGIKRVFIDRGIPDGFAYVEEGTEIHKIIQKEVMAYKGVFFIQNMGKIHNTPERHEDFLSAVEIGRRIISFYQTAGYKIKTIPVSSVEKRTDKILRIVERGGPFR